MTRDDWVSGKSKTADRLDKELRNLRKVVQDSITEVEGLLSEAGKPNIKTRFAFFLATPLNGKEGPALGDKVNKLVGKLGMLKDQLEDELGYSKKTYQRLQLDAEKLLQEKESLAKEFVELQKAYETARQDYSSMGCDGNTTPDELKKRVELERSFEKAKEKYELACLKLETLSKAAEINKYYDTILKQSIIDSNEMVSNVSDTMKKLDILFSTMVSVTKFAETEQKHFEAKGIKQEEKTLEILVADCQKFIQMPLESLEHLYKTAVKRVNVLEYTKEDLALFFKNLGRVESGGKLADEFGKRGGVYLSALINKIAKPGDRFEIHLGQKIGSCGGVPPTPDYYQTCCKCTHPNANYDCQWYNGRRDKARKRELEELGYNKLPAAFVDRIGCLLHEVELEVYGDVGARLGEQAKKTRINVNGTATILVGEGAEYSKITVKKSAKVSQNIGVGTEVVVLSESSGFVKYSKETGSLMKKISGILESIGAGLDC